MKLFQIQILLGDAFGKLGNYADAVSYYQYALDAIHVDDRLVDFDFSEIAGKLAEARNSATSGSIKDGFDAYQEALKNIDIVNITIYTHLHSPGSNPAVHGHNYLCYTT